MTDQQQQQQHPITPPPELVREWVRSTDISVKGGLAQHVATQAARWGADQELEACCADIHTVCGQQKAVWLLSMRRPKPPSLKEQALAVLEDASNRLDAAHENIIRRAIESLPD